MTDILVRILVAIVALWLIITYLVPMLPGPFDTVIMVVIVVCAIVWLLRTGGLIS